MGFRAFYTDKHGAWGPRVGEPYDVSMSRLFEAFADYVDERANVTAPNPPTEEVGRIFAGMIDGIHVSAMHSGGDVWTVTARRPAGDKFNLGDFRGFPTAEAIRAALANLNTWRTA